MESFGPAQLNTDAESQGHNVNNVRKRQRDDDCDGDVSSSETALKVKEARTAGTYAPKDGTSPTLEPKVVTAVEKEALEKELRLLEDRVQASNVAWSISEDKANVSAILKAAEDACAAMRPLNLPISMLTKHSDELFGKFKAAVDKRKGEVQKDKDDIEEFIMKCLTKGEEKPFIGGYMLANIHAFTSCALCMEFFRNPAGAPVVCVAAFASDIRLDLAFLDSAERTRDSTLRVAREKFNALIVRD